MKSFFWSKNVGALDYEDFPENVNPDAFYDYHIEITTRELHIGQSHETKPAQILKCRVCGSDKFIIGQMSCFTAIKCPNCGYEFCIHEG